MRTSPQAVNEMPDIRRGTLVDPATSALVVRGLTVSYHGQPALWHVDYTAPPHGLVAIIGPNGAGKSTFLKAILGLVPSLAGTVRVFGRPVGEMRRRIGYVPQRSSVDWDFPISAREVVEMGLYGRLGWFRRITKGARAEAMAALDQVGMADHAERQIGQLSGGQQQRVFLARALAQDADVYFMDEPFAGVDAATERAIIDVLQDLDRRGRSVFCVHHDLETVGDTFDHALLLNVGALAAGPVRDVMTRDVLERAYGSRLHHLDLGIGVPEPAGR